MLGIEASGVVEAAPGTTLRPGQKAVALMGGMGRSFDGGYAEYTLVPAGQVIPVDTDLDWAGLGALPEALQTAYGSLTTGVGARDADAVLIRGGTSAVGILTVLLAKRRGMTVLSTTRREQRRNELLSLGVDHALIDHGRIAEEVRDLVPGGVDGAVELVGAPTLRDTLRATRAGGTVCFTGMLSNEWIIRDFYPIEFIPKGVRLTAYSGEAADLPAEVLSEVANALRRGEAHLPVTVRGMDEIVAAHDDMEHNRVLGKQVVVTRG
nr:zinc-binding dehydrogenase [Modestobacter caceresii]